MDSLTAPPEADATSTPQEEEKEEEQQQQDAPVDPAKLEAATEELVQKLEGKDVRVRYTAASE